MDTKKFLIGTLVGGLVFFLGGYLIYGMALMNFMSQHSGSATGVAKSMDEISFGSIGIGNLAGAALLSYIFLKWANVQSFASGASSGAIIGFLVGLCFDMTMYGTSNVLDMTGVATDIAAATVLWGISGGAIGAVIGMGKK